MSDSSTNGGGRRRVLAGVALAAAAAGIALVATFVVRQQSPPRASSSGTVTAPRTTSTADADTSTTTPAPEGSSAPVQKPVGSSRPTAISIPAIGVDSSVIAIGKDADGGLAVPEGKDIDKVAWFEKSPTPGQIGPSVLEGHIDSVKGPSVFYRLASVHEGDKVRVDRKDGTTAVFIVSGVRAYDSKGAFPTKLVYGGDISNASLRLVTCSNFDESTGHYAGNTVVYAQLDHVRGR